MHDANFNSFVRQPASYDKDIVDSKDLKKESKVSRIFNEFLETLKKTIRRISWKGINKSKV